MAKRFLILFCSLVMVSMSVQPALASHETPGGGETGDPESPQINTEHGPPVEANPDYYAPLLNDGTKSRPPSVGVDTVQSVLRLYFSLVRMVAR